MAKTKKSAEVEVKIPAKEKAAKKNLKVEKPDASEKVPKLKTKKAGSKNIHPDSDWFSLISDFDIYLFKQGKHFKLYEKLGAHPRRKRGHQRNNIRRLGTQCRASFCGR
jgi:1,4-alpha-glucan branching enzyme